MSGPLELKITGRRAGKTASAIRQITEALARGEHVHVGTARDGYRCAGGHPDCLLTRVHAPEYGMR